MNSEVIKKMKGQRKQYNGFGCSEKICLAIAAAVFIYTCFRAALISISHDEALTFLIHSRGSFKDILGHTLWFSSNNHLINTFLIKLCVGLFGNSEFVIRMPALLGHALYLSGMLMILKLFMNGVPLLLSYGLAVTNPFLVDFFSCGRGYSLAVGFMIMGVYYIFRGIVYPEEYRAKDDVIAVLMFTLSVLSHLAYLNVYLSFVGVLLIQRMYAPKKFGIAVASVAVSAIILRSIYNTGVIQRISMSLFEWGGIRGFWTDTVSSLLNHVLYGQPYSGSRLICWSSRLIFAFYVISLAVVVYAILKRKLKQPEYGLLVWVTCLLFFIAVGMRMEFAFFKIKYAIGRAALYIIPIYVIMISLLLKTAVFIARKWARRMVLGALYVLIFVVLVHNAVCFNITHFYTWGFDAHTKEAMNIIRAASTDKIHSLRKVTIGINWIFEPATNYYIFKDNLYWINWTTRNGPDGEYDYYYFCDGDKDIVNKHNLKIIRHFEIFESYVALPNKNILLQK